MQCGRSHSGSWPSMLLLVTPLHLSHSFSPGVTTSMPPLFTQVFFLLFPLLITGHPEEIRLPASGLCHLPNRLALLHWPTLLQLSDQCLKNQGGMVSTVMCSLAQEIIAWSELYSVTVCEIHSRKENIPVDQLSCPDQVLTTEWSLLLQVRCTVILMLTYFDTRANVKLKFTEAWRQATCPQG